MNRQLIWLDDGSDKQNPLAPIHARNGNPLSAANPLRAVDSVDVIEGVLDHYRGYRIQTTTPVDFQATNPRTSSAPALGGSLRAASFNVENSLTVMALEEALPIEAPSVVPTVNLILNDSQASLLQGLKALMLMSSLFKRSRMMATPPASQLSVLSLL